MSSSPENRSCWNRREWIRIAAALAAANLHAEEVRSLAPPDPQQLDPALAALLLRLKELVAKRNHVGLEALMLPTFRVEFDDGKGPAAFRRYWHPESPDSAVWGILERLLALPGHSYSPTLFAVPYLFARFPFDLDLLGHVVGVNGSASLLAEPRPDAPRLGSVDHAILALANPMEPPVVIPSGEFVELRHPEFGRCFAASSDIYHPAAHRAFFEKRQGRWRWISLAAATTKDPPELRLHGASAG